MIEDILGKSIKEVSDFPNKGILFKDIGSLMLDHFSLSIGAMFNLYSANEWSSIDAVVGIEARGFIFGAALAQKASKPFLMIRKGGKLPGSTYKVDYSLEYNSGSLEMQKLNTTLNKVLIVDDVCATGGTFLAAQKLCKLNNFQEFEFCSLINLKYLNGNNTPNSLKAVINYEE